MTAHFQGPLVFRSAPNVNNLKGVCNSIRRRQMGSGGEGGHAGHVPEADPPSPPTHTPQPPQPAPEAWVRTHFPVNYSPDVCLIPS